MTTRTKIMLNLCASVFICGSLLLAGCATEDKKEDSVRARQEKALQDPYGYKADVPRNDVSGGGLFEYDRDAMRKDVDSVLK